MIVLLLGCTEVTETWYGGGSVTLALRVSGDDHLLEVDATIPGLDADGLEAFAEGQNIASRACEASGSGAAWGAGAAYACAKAAALEIGWDGDGEPPQRAIGVVLEPEFDGLFYPKLI